MKQSRLITILITTSILLSGIPFNSLEAQISYLFPVPGSRYISTHTTLILRISDERFDASAGQVFHVRNSSGSLSGVEHVAQGGKTLIFRPDEQFKEGDTIHVSLGLKSFGLADSSFSFMISGSELTREEKESVIQNLRIRSLPQEELKSSEPLLKQYQQPVIMNGVSLPSDFPVFEPWIHKETANGYLFLANWLGTPYMLILENDGTPFFYRKLPQRTLDFKVQNDSTLSRWVVEDVHGYVSLDKNYNRLREYRCQGDYTTDEHDLVLTDEGTAILAGLDVQSVDMSELVPGGDPDALVVGNIIQEIDSLNQVIFEWRSWDHFEITDALHLDLLGDQIDYMHVNSVALDYDGHILVSSRHLSECTKINRETGEVMWRLSGKNNQFDFVNDILMTSYQHDFRAVPGIPGNYTIFDNGNHRTPEFSRAVEFRLDTSAMTAEKVWEYRHLPEDIFSSFMGSAQRLPNGNTLINWANANLPKATEVTPGGEIVYEGDFNFFTHGYRTFRFDWSGALTTPYLIAEGFPSWVTLVFNQFGSDSIDYYKVFGGTRKDAMTLMDTTSSTWYSTADLENNTTWYFQITSVDHMGIESEPSNTDSVSVKFLQPGDELVLNGDFSASGSYWNFFAIGGASAQGSVSSSGEYRINISNGGSDPSEIQLAQRPIPLVKGEKYRLSFDARSAGLRPFRVLIAQSQPPYSRYFIMDNLSLTDESQHFSFDFVMEDTTDLNARLVFHAGGHDADVYLDNISLLLISGLDGAGVILADRKPRFQIAYLQAEDIIECTVEGIDQGSGKVEIFNMSGELITKSPNHMMVPGKNILREPVNLQQGLYIVRLTVSASPSLPVWVQTQLFYAE